MSILMLKYCLKLQLSNVVNVSIYLNTLVVYPEQPFVYLGF
jgi:hypothetical protein